MSNINSELPRRSGRDYRRGHSRIFAADRSGRARQGKHFDIRHMCPETPPSRASGVKRSARHLNLARYLGQSRVGREEHTDASRRGAEPSLPAGEVVAPYTSAELTDMVYVYVEARRVAVEASPSYVERYPDRRQSAKKAFAAVLEANVSRPRHHRSEQPGVEGGGGVRAPLPPVPHSRSSEVTGPGSMPARVSPGVSCRPPRRQSAAWCATRRKSRARKDVAPPSCSSPSRNISEEAIKVTPTRVPTAPTTLHARFWNCVQVLPSLFPTTADISYAHRSSGVVTRPGIQVFITRSRWFTKQIYSPIDSGSDQGAGARVAVFLFELVAGNHCCYRGVDSSRHRKRPGDILVHDRSTASPKTQRSVGKEPMGVHTSFSRVFTICSTLQD
ncbi:hypothetical protein PR048_008453 [Dryococelus australis]|uniref:Uncharacterized protein n=1 Tax=Dryococelus australis TaxID=614101 RepID=A0ABQ9HX69_9NEOP|nr:hypothetical protein PR048_008453 [Dryococelus australis]